MITTPDPNEGKLIINLEKIRVFATLMPMNLKLVLSFPQTSLVLEMFRHVDEIAKKLRITFKTGRIEFKGHHLIPTDQIMDVVPKDAEVIFYSCEMGLFENKPVELKGDEDIKSPYSSLCLSAHYKLKNTGEESNEFLSIKRSRENMSVAAKSVNQTQGGNNKQNNQNNNAKNLQKGLKDKQEQKHNTSNQQQVKNNHGNQNQFKNNGNNHKHNKQHKEHEQPKKDKKVQHRNSEDQASENIEEDNVEVLNLSEAQSSKEEHNDRGDKSDSDSDDEKVSNKKGNNKPIISSSTNKQKSKSS